MKNGVTDREVYPALWITLAVMGGLYLLWRGPLNRPAVSGCWVYTHWHLYCPGCGGTRALTALFQGRLLRSFLYHPAVLFSAVSVGSYLASQTLWRLRGRRGWVLHYSDRWLCWLLVLLLVNCGLRNLLWLGLGIPI